MSPTLLHLGLCALPAVAVLLVGIPLVHTRLRRLQAQSDPPRATSNLRIVAIVVVSIAFVVLLARVNNVVATVPLYAALAFWLVRSAARASKRRASTVPLSRAEVLSWSVLHVALLLALWPVCAALDSYQATAARCPEYCRTIGYCRPVPIWLHGAGWSAFKDALRGDHFACKPGSTADCLASESCRGAASNCTYRDGDCVTTQEDCGMSEGCFSHGSCGLRDGACVVTDEGCKHTSDCRERGWCGAGANNLCRAKASDDCLHTAGCYEDGRCSPVDGDCALESSDDCRKTRGCLASGDCSLVDGRCGKSDADCQRDSDCLLDGDCSAKNGRCHTVSDADCEKTWACGLRRQCKQDVRGYCLREDSPRCATSAACSIYGRCDEVTGLCVARSDEKCQASRNCKESGACKRFGDECAASCETTAACVEYGRCSCTAKGNEALSSEDCSKSRECVKYGRCTLKDGDCKRVSDSDCQKSLRCKVDGDCHLVASERTSDCKPGDDSDCAQSEGCKRTGKCFLGKDGLCTGRFDPSHCKSSAQCRVRGECTANGAQCVVGSDQDCAASDVCKKRGWCKRVEYNDHGSKTVVCG